MGVITAGSVTSYLKALAQNLTPGRAGSGNSDELRMTPDGALYTADYLLAAGIEGRLFGANMGLVTTPISTAATTAITNTVATAWVRVPNTSTAIIPIRASIVVEATGATTQGELSILIAQNDIGVTGAVADAGPICLNTGAPVVSACLPRQLGTATTAPTNPIELDRFGFAASAVNQKFVWDARAQGGYPVVRGLGSWAIYAGGNAASLFVQMVWLELPITAVT